MVAPSRSDLAPGIEPAGDPIRYLPVETVVDQGVEKGNQLSLMVVGIVQGSGERVHLVTFQQQWLGVVCC